MADQEGARAEPHLSVFHNRSVLVDEQGQAQTFFEGQLSPAARDRLDKIRVAMAAGFLHNLIEECKRPDVYLGELSVSHTGLLEQLVRAVTSEVGRALVGLTVLQLCVKHLAPQQSIRLHKGGRHGQGSFSWVEGIPMRTLDNTYITPTLRQHDLLRLNADGFMMTRSLAENYPYTRLYKAAIRGARNEWLNLVDLIESGEINAEAALRRLIVLLLNRSSQFQKDAQDAMTSIFRCLRMIPQLIK